MRCIIAAAAFAVLAVPGFAFAAGTNAPYEQNVINRALPDVDNRVPAGQASAASGEAATGVWANDFSFISPAR